MKRAWVFLFMTLICAGYISPAGAIEPLNYQKNISPTLEYEIDLFLKKEYRNDLSQYRISSIDLNNDGIDEHILKSRQCEMHKRQCTHLILAEKNDGILLLSKIRAYNLMIGGTSSHGVKDILAFTDDINDYNFNIYMWSPPRKMYILGLSK